MKIRLDNVVKTFDTFRAVHGVSLDIESGELVALLGPSGSGKTTILRMVAGLEYADGGHIYFGDAGCHRHSGARPRRRLRVPALCAVPAYDRGRKHRLRHEGFEGQAHEAGNSVRASPNSCGWSSSTVWASAFPTQISGGQRQRVALARALAVDPKVLLLDEPFGALDANVRRDLRRWLREIHEELGITTLFVTHDQEEALDLADRVVILNEGKIVQEGTPEAVCRNPNSAFVMNFLGDANRLRATVTNGKAEFGGTAAGGGRLRRRAGERLSASARPRLVGVASPAFPRPSCASSTGRTAAASLPGPRATSRSNSTSHPRR